MAQYCHDQYDHPLLWCDDKRRAEERKIAQESIAEARQRRQDDEAKKTRELREVRKMFDLQLFKFWLMRRTRITRNNFNIS